MRPWNPLLPLVALASTAVSQASLAELERGFARDRDRLYADGRRPTAEQEAQLVSRHTEQLRAFLDERADGDDRWNGRLLLADLCLMQRQREDAVEALQGIEVSQAPAVLLLLAAEVAAELGQRPLRDRLVDQAVQRAMQRDAPLAERMELGKLLMTLLREVERGEQVFADALRAADDDEARARVRWYRCEAIREREDLPENSYYRALEELAREFPDTYYGSVAKDRGTASQFAIGAAAIPFRATTTAGEELSLAALRGKPVVLAFWSATDQRAKSLIDNLQQLHEQGSDLLLLGISMDDDKRAFERASKSLGAAFPQICDGRGFATELALRYHVETAPTLIVLDRQGRIAGLNLHIDTRDARDELNSALERARRPNK